MRALWVCVCLVLGMSGVAWAEEASPRVAVLPFEVRSQQDTAATQRLIMELLNGQLTQEGARVVDTDAVLRATGPVAEEDRARSVARALNADYAVMGSFTEIGNLLSLDARLVDATGEERTQILFVEERGMENLASATNQLVQMMAVHVLAKALIAEVQVRGSERIEPDAIRLNIRSREGDLLRPEQVAEDIRSIYAMHYFESVEASVEDSPAGKILIFDVVENPTILEVRVEGNKNIKESDILAAISTRQYAILQRNVIAEDVQRIIRLYHQKGYFNAEVTTSIDFPRDPRRAVVTFDIEEDRKVYIRSISFIGNENFSDRRLRGIMQTKQRSFVSWFTDRGVLQRDVLETDVDRLSVFYQDQGFMDARVGTPVVETEDDGFHIVIPIEEGSRYRVASVRVRGDLLENMEEITRDLKAQEGEYFRREAIRDDIRMLSTLYMDEGFANVDVAPEVRRNPEDRTAEIVYNIIKNEKVRIGRIYISGNTKTRDRVIRREMQFAEGDYYSATKLERSLLNLRKLDYFEDVEIIPADTDQRDVVNLHVRVREKLTGAISIGGGFSSDDGLFASGEVTQRNLMGRGQTVGLRAYFGQEAQRYVFSFTEPWLFDRRIIAGIDLYNWLREYNDFTKDALGVRLRTGFPFGNYSRFNTYYIYEDARVTDVDENASAFIRDQEGRQVKSSVTFGLERDTTDHPFVPTRGSLNWITTEYSTPFLGSDSDYLKLELQSGWFFPIFWKLTGFMRGKFGYIEELDGARPAPIYERFFLGGINSLRGFRWGDVGPMDEQGEIIGGLTYGLVNVEVLFPLMEDVGIRGLVFFDAGNSFLSMSDFDVSEFRTSAGAGVRWNSPLGPLRLEWGYNLDPKPGEDSYQWQFSAGAFF